MNILVVLNMIVPQVGDDQRRAIEEAAGPGARIAIVRERDEALAAIRDAEVLLGFIDPELYAHAPRLRWVQASASGVDAMLFAAMMQGDVVLTCERGMVGSHLADHAMALLLAVARRLAEAVRLGPGAWDRRLALRRQAVELEGLALAIIGYGGTGRALARRAAGFGMTIRALDRFPVAATAEVPFVEPLERLHDLLADADVVALCLPLTRDTAGMFGKACFDGMKPGAILLNVTRGELVEPGALVAALESGRLGGAGLDVQHVEPLPADDPLWRFPNVVLTPHIAGASPLRAGRVIGRFVENLRRYRKGEPLLGVVDKALGF